MHRCSHPPRLPSEAPPPSPGLAACGSSSDGPVSSPGSLGPVADITADVGAGSGGGGTGSYTGACSTELKGDGSGETEEVDLTAVPKITAETEAVLKEDSAEKIDT